MDVKVVFLNETLGEDVYMMQPKSFVDPKNVGENMQIIELYI
jgi:hypothetical protein